MGWPPRPQLLGGIYHVTSRGVRRKEIFLSDGDRRYFLALLERVVRRRRWRCHAYCLMSNHYHLLVTTPAGDISAGMQWLKSRYARDFNAQHGFSGHLFERRFHSLTVDSNEHLVELSRYIAANPVRAGLCGRAEDWPWSSFRQTIGLAPRGFLTLPLILDQFGLTPAQAQRNYAAFVNEASGAAPEPDRPLGTRPVSDTGRVPRG